jgi:DNA-binding IclR family transcriptional regulator
MNKLPAQKINGLIDGIAVLQELAIQSEPVSGLHLARELGLEPTKVNRILKTLAFLDLAYRTTSRKYTVGPSMHVLAAQSMAASGLIRKAVKHLDKLSEYGHIVAFGMLWRDKVTYLYHRSPTDDLISGITRLQPLPATRSSIGLALLAEKSDEYIAALYKGKPVPGFNDNLENLMRKIRQTRKQGYAAVRTDHISLAVTTGTPTYAAIAISGFKDPKEEKKYFNIIKEASNTIEQNL